MHFFANHKQTKYKDNMQVMRLRPSSFTGIKKRLGYLKPIALAKKLKVVVRKPKKILVTNLLLSYWLLISKGKSSYENWAMELSMLQKETVSSQAICCKSRFIGGSVLTPIC